VLGELRGDGLGDAAPPGSHRADDVENFGGGHILNKVAYGPSVERLVNVLVATIGREDDHLGVGKLVEDRSGRGEPVHDRHAEVHQDDVRPQLPIFLERLLAVSRLRNNLETGLGLEIRH
jgi:hypothetical protein